MKVRRIAALIVVLLAAWLVVFLAPVFNQSGTKGAGNDSPDLPQKREAMRAYMEEGRSLLAAGKGAEAEAAFRNAQDVLPSGRVLDAEVGIAEALLLQGKPQEAVALYRRVVAEHSPGWPELLLKYGSFCDRAGLPEEAVSAYRQAFAVRRKESDFPVRISGNPSPAELREKARQALALYEPPRPE